jgi:hypothetical protein
LKETLLGDGSFLYILSSFREQRLEALVDTGGTNTTPAHCHLFKIRLVVLSKCNLLLLRIPLSECEVLSILDLLSNDCRELTRHMLKFDS